MTQEEAGALWSAGAQKALRAARVLYEDENKESTKFWFERSAYFLSQLSS